VTIERLSLELTRECSKGCSFCYNGSYPAGDTRWTVDEVVGLAVDCAGHGLRALSLGGGEPLQYPGLYDILCQLDGRLFRSVTTNGLPLDRAFEALVAARPDKVHVSIHFPDRIAEVDRVIRQVTALHDAGVTSGVNLRVGRQQVGAATIAARRLADAGIGPERVMYLPLRGGDTPTPEQMAAVAGGPRFQSVSCLLACGRSPRFVSLDWDRRAAWCSYTATRVALPSLDHAGLSAALVGLGLAFCG
jgi:MoaA/NifB/PqqE/SkfB family radical SAM enzyme